MTKPHTEPNRSMYAFLNSSFCLSMCLRRSNRVSFLSSQGLSLQAILFSFGAINSGGWMTFLATLATFGIGLGLAQLTMPPAVRATYLVQLQEVSCAPSVFFLGFAFVCWNTALIQVVFR